ncbi:hypothetical protein ASPFODRAFT_521768 [Aspergillus luchuensis CBS 106.47]|uniref:Uncharacterized protein n=1 Tax=Aspergillus luchuensis (strain CBS 106.47) TaxID=1137211 RepID=A0A1M3SYZ3_ASPLC|nr:hypothetical protein ASPFODRAFT_521768 [Aspergillus luchuensis CBS 106.47]
MVSRWLPVAISYTQMTWGSLGFCCNTRKFLDTWRYLDDIADVAKTQARSLGMKTLFWEKYYRTLRGSLSRREICTCSEQTALDYLF